VKNFLLRPTARADLDEIWDYTAQRWSIEQADRYIRDIIAVCHRLADGSKHGRPISDVREGYFKIAVGQHFLIYRLTKDSDFDIVRVLHQRMDIPDRLQ
jgi:toxin ParE1/3/4